MPHVKLFLLFYWIMTGFHALHVTIGIGAVLIIAILAWQGQFSPAYYSPVDVPACTGTLSTWCGFSCCRCCTCWDTHSQSELALLIQGPD